MRRTSRVDSIDLIAEWDAVAKSRHEQIITGVDVSYNEVLTPAVLALCPRDSMQKVLDVGCGSGILTRKLGEISGEVIGVDPSSVSIGIARDWCRGVLNVRFMHSSVETLAQDVTLGNYSTVVANMTLMDCIDLRGTLHAIARLSASHAYCVGTITHPCFWPIYWGYQGESWFDYGTETAIRTPFRIQRQSLPFETTHFHRPLEAYLECIRESGFGVEVMRELGIAEVARGKLWHGKYPKFLSFRLVKQD